MSARHDHLIAAINDVLAAVELKDAAGAQTATAEMMKRIQDTPQPLADERVHPLFLRCQQKAEAFHHELEVELKSTAIGARATRAYQLPRRR